MVDESVPSTIDDVPPPADVQLSRGLRALCLALGLVAAGGGAVAVFETENAVGSAALLALGVYFLVSGNLGHFPRLVLMGNEIDPRALRKVKQEVQNAQVDSEKAKVNSEDVVEGLADTRRRVEELERSLKARAEESSKPSERPPTPPSTRTEEQPGPLTPGVDETAERDADVPGRLLGLASRYNEVRWTMKSGVERTRVMTEIVDDMMAISRETVVSDPVRLLQHEDRGLRLVGVVYLYERPDPTYVPELAQVALTPDKPFNEYWALLALRKTLIGHCGKLNATLRSRLNKRLGEIPSSSDRAGQIRGILDDCP